MYFLFCLFCQQDTGFPIEQEIRQIFSKRARDVVEREKYGRKERTRLDIKETMEALYFRKFSAKEFIRITKYNID